DVISQWIERTFKEIDLGELPRAVQEDLVADVKRKLIASAEPNPDARYDTARAFEFGDPEQTPGVQLRLSLDPTEWLADPKKQFDSTMQKWGKELFSWDDIRNYAEKKYFWEPLVSGKYNLN